MTLYNVVRALMRKYPDLYAIKPNAYQNREKLVLHTRRILLRNVSPESITRTQRKVWKRNDVLGE